MTEPITEQWLLEQTWIKKEPYVFSIRDSTLSLFIYYHRSGFFRGLWSIERELDNGDEQLLCYVSTIEELQRMLRIFNRVAMLAPITWQEPPPPKPPVQEERARADAYFNARHDWKAGEGPYPA